MLTKRRVAVGAIAVAAIASGVLWAVMSTAASAGPQFSPSGILQLARTIAAQSGDKTPTLIQHAMGTRADANRIAGGDVVFDNRPSYLVVVHGHFTVKPESPPIPPGVPSAPQPATLTYSIMTLVVDASTGRVTDYGLTNGQPDLPALGAVTTDASSTSSAG